MADTLMHCLGILQYLKEQYDNMNDNKKIVHYLLKRVFDMDPVLKSMAIFTSLNDDKMKILRQVF